MRGHAAWGWGLVLGVALLLAVPAQAVITALLCRAEREHDLAIGDEEIDISSWKPVRWISTRNKVAAWMPLSLDPLVRTYYAVAKRVDRAAIRLRRRLVS